MSRWTRLTLMAGFGVLALTVTPPALADGPCPTLDLTCDLEGATDDVGDAVDEIVGPVEETTEPIVGEVLEGLDAILGGGGSVDPPGGGGDGDGPPGVGGNGGEVTTGEGRGLDGRLTPGSSGITPRQVIDGTGVGPKGVSPQGDGLLGYGPREGFGGVVAGAARSTLIVMVLLAVALVFVAIQNRLDRNDPKLALAQVRPDVLRFE